MNRRFAWFDCLRCAAVAWILLAHCGPLAKVFSPGFGRVFTDAQAIAWFGVDLFFVLSGFLVSGLLFDEYDAHGKINLGRFLIRRGFKIIPPFYFLVLVTAVVDAVFHLKYPRGAYLMDLTFFQSYGPGNWLMPGPCPWRSIFTCCSDCCSIFWPVAHPRMAAG